MGILDIFKPNNQSSGGSSGGSSAASSAPKLVNTSPSSSGGNSGGSSGSVLSNFWSSLKNTVNAATGQNKQPTLLQPLQTTNKSSTPNSLVTIPSSSKNGSAQTKVGGGLVKIGDSLAQTKVGSGLIKVGNDLVEGYKSTVKDINDAFIPQAESKIQNPTKIVTTEMPVTGNERLDKVLSDYRAKATEAYSAEWREKYKGQDLDASLAALKQEIDKAPTTTDMDLVERSKKIAEYQFLEAVKNYGIAMDYDLQGGYSQIDQMDKQIAELKKLEQQYVDTHQGNDIQNWNVSDDDQYTKVKNMSDEEYQQVRADLAALEQYRKALYNEVNDVKQVQLGSIYAGIAADKDFEEYSKKGATMDGNERVKKADSKKSVYHFMTDEEAKMYDALFAASGKEAADTYVDVFLKDALNARKGGELAENWMTPFGMKNDAGKVFGALALLGPAGMIGGIRGLGNQIKGIGPGKSGEMETTALDYASGIAREKLGEIDTSLKLPNGESYELRVNGANLPQILADAAQSGGNMAPSILAGYLVGLIPGGQGAAAEIVARAVMGGSVYGKVKSEMLKAGYNEQSASTYAALNATSEVALESAIGGFEQFGGVMGIPGVQEHLGNISNAYLRYAATMGMKIHSEGQEEYLQDVIDPLFKNIAFHENNEFNPISKEGAYSYLVAAISTFGLEGHSTRVNTAKCEAAGAYVNAVREANPELYDLLINEALEGENKEIRELAEGIKNGEYKATNGNLGQLLLQMAQDGKYKQPERLVRESAEHLAELKIENVRGFAQSKAQEEWDTLVMSHPGKTVLDPVVSELLQKAGWDVETAQKQGEILTKVFSGIVPTGREIVALDRNNTHVQEIFKKYTGMDLSTVKDKAEAARMLIDAARNAWETETYQEALRDANEKFMTGRTEMLMNSQYAPQVEQAEKDAMTGTDLQIGKRKLSAKKNAPIIPEAEKTGTTAVSGFDRESFIKDYMDKHGVDQKTAEEAWEKRAALMAVLNGGNVNGEQVRSDSTGRIDGLAGREGTSEVHDGAVGSDGSADAGRGASTRESGSSSEAEKVTGQVIPAEAYSEEQREFVQSCIKDGFKEVELIDGPLYNAAGQLLNAKVDSATGKLTISATDKTTMIKVARHERVHLWLDAFGNGRARAVFVEQTLNRILSQEMLDKLYAAYSRVYTKAYHDLLLSNPDAFTAAIYEEILCDMAGGMANYGVNAGAYQNAATKLLTDSRIRERFLENGPRMTESQSRVSTENVGETAETATENVGETAETATENVEARPIEDRVRETINWDDEGEIEEYDEDEEFDDDLPPGGWYDDDRYSVAPDTPKQAPVFLSPFKADTRQDVPPDVRPFPGENAMHSQLDRFSVSGMVQGANFELKLNSAGYPYQVLDKATGKPIKHVEPYMMKDTPLGNLIEMAMTDGSLKDLPDDQKIAAAEAQYKMLADAMNLIVEYNDAALVWELVGSQMFSAIKSNSDTQYNRTIDFSTICKKTQAIVNAMSETMKQLNRGLTRREVEAVYLETGKAGESTPCPVCYVFSRWMGIGNLLDQINRFQTRFADMDEAEIVTFMEQIEEDAHAYAEEQIKKAKDPEKKRKSFYDKNGEFKLGKVLSSMKPNSNESAAIKALSAHQQATARIAELEAAMETATPEQQTEYKKWIKSLKKLTLSEKKLAATQQKLETADAEIERLEAYQWLASTLMMKGQKVENGRPVFDENGEPVNVWQKNPRFKPVPGDILFDLNKGADFAEKYPLTWAFRTGKGCAMGKAITPYADARVGETIQGVAGGIKDIRVSEMAVDDEGFLRPVEDKDVNEFLNGDTKKQQATLASAIKNMKRQNLIGGMRYQSTSDFRYEYGSDYLMTFFEMQAMGANVQLYTKVIEAVDFLASTGADCNLSLMPKADGYQINPKTGKKELDFSDVTGINHKAAIAKAKQYDNVQCILVGINDDNIRLALESEDVTFVIPFHGSGQSVHQIQTLMDMLGEHLDVMQAEDYTSVQSDREIPNRAEEHPELQAMWDLRMDIIMGNLQDGVTEEQSRLLDQNPHLQKLYDMFYVNEKDPAYQNFLAKDQAAQIFPYEYWDKTTTYETADRNGEIFKSYCESMGVVPRFSGKNSKNQDTGFGNFAYGGENGQCVKGYWKLLIDRKMYKNVYDEAGNWTGYGEYREQQQINMSNVKLENLDPKWGKANFTEKEMSKPIDTTKTEDIVAKSIKAIETLRATGDIFDRTAVTPNARKILTETQLNRQPTSAELLKQESAKLQERASVAEEESAPTSEEIQNEDVEMEPVISPEVSAREVEETDTRYSIRTEDPPKKTMIGYKVFRVDKNHKGQLYPTKVANPEGQGTPVGVWLNADTGEIARDKEGNIKTNKSGRIAVKAGSETLAWRPGWHLGELPEANQMNQYDPNNPDADRVSEGVMHDDYVFCECEFAADEDYQLEAFQMGFNAKGGYLHSQAGLPFIPKDGYYKYRTNPDPNTAPWFISGAIKITKILDDDMRREIIEKWNAEHPDDPPMRVAPRYSGKDIDLTEYGFEAGPVTPTENLDEIAPGVDYSDEIKDLPGYKPNHINWENKNFQNAFKINGIENRKEELRQKYEANRERYSIAGPDAQTANTESLQEAQSRVEAGEDEEKVRRDTGWFRGMDGKWRFEIDNSEAVFDRRGHVETTVALRDLANKFTLSEEDVAEHERLVKQLQNAPKGEVVSDFLYHPALFEAYPQLAEMPLSFGKLGRDILGSYIPWKREIVLSNSIARNDAAARSVLLHELQHAIQYIEGFATGTNAGDSNYRTNAGEIEARDVQTRLNMTPEQRKNTPPDLGGATRYSVSDEDVSDKIKEAETGGKHPVNQPTDTVSQTESDVNTEQYSVFSDQVDKVKNNTINRQQAVVAGQTPRPLTEILWLPKLPMFITPKHVYSMAVSERQARAERRFESGTNYHDLGWDIVKQIPEQLGHPVLIIKSNTDPNNADVLVITDLVDKIGRPVAIAIRPNGTGKQLNLSLPENAILSGYGRKNVQDYVARAKTENRILYANKNNHRRGSRGVQYSNASAHNGPGVQFSDTIMSGDYSTNLAQYRQIVKDKVKGTIFENSVGLNYSVSDESNQSKKTESPFPKGSLEDNLYGLMTAKTIDEAETWLNKQREKSELGKDARKTKPVIPKADDVIPVGKVERKVHQNEIEELIDKYGQMPAGEKAAREARVPNKTGPDSHVRRFVRNVEEAPNTSQRTIEQIEREIITGSDVANYARITDTKAVNAADNYYKTYGYNGLKNEWDRVSSVENKVPTKYDVAKGERLLIEADRQGDAATVLKVVADLAALGTEAGQVVQAMRLLKKMGPVGQLYYFQKAVDRLNKRFETRIMKGKLEPIHIDKALAQKVLLADTQEEIDAAMKELVKETAKQLPVNLLDQWNAWRYLAMLANPRTHIRNWLGNDFFRPLRFTKDLLAAAGETIFLRDRSQRTKSGKYLLSGGRFSPAYTALNAAAASDFEVMKAQITGTGKMNPMNELLQAREIFRGPLKFLNKISDFNSELLEKEDLFFLKRAYINAMAEYMAARGLTAEDIDEDSKELNQARQYAVQEAQKATYRDFCWAANALNQLKGTTGGAILIDGLVPFTKTPINIGKRGVEYSPIGLLKGLTFDLIKVQKGDLTAAEAIDHIAAGMSGTMIAVLGVLLAKLGIARGADDDDKKKAELERAQGHQEYSLEIGGRSFTVDWVAPVSLPFFVGVEAYKHITEGGPMDFYDFADVLTLILEPMTSLSMLDGINQTLSAASYADNNAVQAVLTSIGTSYLSQGLPTLGAQLARTIDPYRRSNYTDKGDKAPGWMQTFVQQNMGKIPGVSQEKMAYVDTWGRKQTSGGMGMRALENFIFPFYMKTVNENPVERELMRLAKATGDNDVLPSSISKSFTVDGETLNLNAKQYEKIKTVTGRESLRLLGEIMMSPAYTELDDAEKTKMIKNAMTITSTLGRQAIREDYKPAAWVQRAIDNDNYEDAVTFHVMQSMESGLSNYQLIECMYWLTPEEQGKLITSQYTPQAKMTDYKQKKHKFILDDDMKARSREIYEEMFWQEYPQLTASQKWADADIAGRAELVKKLQTDVGKAARSAYGDELRAQGIVSVYLDDPDEEAEEIAAVLNEFGYEP